MVELRSRLTAEALGMALLLTIVIGSGIMAERLAGGSAAIALLANTTTTVGGLYALTEALGSISGTHFNPVANAVMAMRDELHGATLLLYIVAQMLDAVLGTWLTHAMFDMTLLQFSTKMCSGTGQWIAKAMATAGLLLIVPRAPNGRAVSIVAAYIGAAYWFAASTLFVSPAAIFGCMFSNNFVGITLGSMPGFVLAECAGAMLGMLLHNLFEPCSAATNHPSVIESSGEHPPYT